jgi:hypothetical protein
MGTLERYYVPHDNYQPRLITSAANEVCFGGWKEPVIAKTSFKVALSERSTATFDAQ